MRHVPPACPGLLTTTSRPTKPHLPPTAFASPCSATWCSPRSRYLHLAWALWEKEQGDVEEARRLFKQGNDRNPRDAAILQVRGR